MWPCVCVCVCLSVGACLGVGMCVLQMMLGDWPGAVGHSGP